MSTHRFPFVFPSELQFKYRVNVNSYDSILLLTATPSPSGKIAV
jgi:hypothetical protein